MVGYTAEGASDSQWFANDPAETWAATKAYLSSKSLRSCDDKSMRLEANLGMTAFTGNCIASISVQPAAQGGSLLRFSGRMGVFSKQNIGAQRRIEDERSKLIRAVSARLPAIEPRAEPASQGTDLATQLGKLGELHAAGVLSDAEFQAAKARLLG